MKKLLIILYSIFFIVGCGEITSWEYLTYKYSECSDSKATNYSWWVCDIESPDYDTNSCQWDIEDCEYCTDNYDTEEERWDNCCNIHGAENYHSQAYEWYENFSQDSTYCIFD